MKFKHKRFGDVRTSWFYLMAKGNNRSCLEGDLQKTFDFTPTVGETKLAFTMPASMNQGDCVDALGRQEKVVHGSKTIFEGMKKLSALRSSSR